ncbi:MAG: hypothetical protein M3Z95_07495, partial [Actinomycetota bacterium]|nr:hypothetical protein [Actinomycetota bacterium]
IRITRVEPERKVEWEAEHTSGTVLIKPSGWGTKVILTVAARSAEVGSTLTPAPRAHAEVPARGEGALRAEPSPPLHQASVPPVAEAQHQPKFEAEREPAIEVQANPQLASDATRPQPELQLEPEPDWELAPKRDSEPEPELEGRRGFLARLLRRLRRKDAVEPGAPEESKVAQPRPECGQPLTAKGQRAEPSADVALPQQSPEQSDALGQFEHMPEQPQASAPVEHACQAQTPVSTQAPLQPASEAAEPDDPPGGHARDARDISAEIRAAEEVQAEQVTAVLTSVLDRLGSAHHRPFSRA